MVALLAAAAASGSSAAGVMAHAAGRLKALLGEEQTLRRRLETVGHHREKELWAVFRLLGMSPEETVAAEHGHASDRPAPPASLPSPGPSARPKRSLGQSTVEVKRNTWTEGEDKLARSGGGRKSWAAGLLRRNSTSAFPTADLFRSSQGATRSPSVAPQDKPASRPSAPEPADSPPALSRSLSRGVGILSRSMSRGVGKLGRK